MNPIQVSTSIFLQYNGIYKDCQPFYIFGLYFTIKSNKRILPFLFYSYQETLFSKSRTDYKLAEARKYSERSPLEDACPLMSSSAGKRGCEFSVRYVWNGAGARLRWNTSSPQRNKFYYPQSILK